MKEMDSGLDALYDYQEYLIKIQINVLPNPSFHEERLFFVQRPNEQDVIDKLCEHNVLYSDLRESLQINHCQPLIKS